MNPIVTDWNGMYYKLQYAMKCDRSWQIGLGRKGTELIAMWRLQYGTWWNVMNPIRTDWNGMDSNMTIQYERWWEAMNHIRTEINWKELNWFQRGGCAMEHDRRWWIPSGWLGTEWIASWQYAMECDRRQQIRLWHKLAEWIATWRFCYKTWWEIIAFFNNNYQRCWSSIESVVNCLPHAWRGHWSTGIFTGRCSCTVIFWICVWSKNATSLDSS